MSKTPETTLTVEQAEAVLSILSREQDRITLKLLAGNELARPHLLRHLAETKIAMQAFEAVS